jgi:hypothetical protein
MLQLRLLDRVRGSPATHRPTQARGRALFTGLVSITGLIGAAIRPEEFPMPSPRIRGVVVFVTTSALLLSTFVPVAVAATPPTLTGEEFSVGSQIASDGPNPPVAQCDPANDSTITLHIVGGFAFGPYPGMFDETLTAVVGPASGDPVPVIGSGSAAVGPVSTFQASFTIYSGDTIVSGTKSGVLAGSLGACSDGNPTDFGSQRVLYLDLDTQYNAQIQTTGGAFSDSGRSHVNYRHVTNYYSDGRVAGEAIGFTETFTSTQPEVIPLGPAVVTLSPPDAVNNVGTNHTVTATVTNAAGGPVTGATVLFSTSGSTSATGSCTTDAVGQCSFTYAGPQLPGADIITGCADSNKNGTAEPGEPCAEATKAWMLPASTIGQTTGGGQVLNAVGNDKIAFGYNAKSSTNGLQGNCTVVDPSPIANIKIKCLDVTSLVQTGTHATFFGNAQVNGVATTYRIDVDDLTEPGAGHDTFKIQTSSGYTAGGTLTNGNIQIHN